MVVVLCALVLGAAAYFGGRGTERYVANPCLDSTGAPCVEPSYLPEVKGVLDIGMEGVGSSDQNGDAQFLEEGSSTRVAVLLAGLDVGTVQSLSVRAGSCLELKDTLYTLNNAEHAIKPWGVVLGESSTLIPVPKESLLATGNFAVVAHATDQPDSKIVSCGDYQGQ